MTKFDYAQIGHRDGKQSGSYSASELRRNMVTFQNTGVHPEVAQRDEDAAAERPDLPEQDADRTHVFMDIAVAGKPLGTLVFEVFNDLAPSASREFINRITGGGAGRAGFVTYERTVINKIVDGVRIEGGGLNGGGG
eukprot:CAMPEP_0197608738 /NCGR_PEP_ID=MMETSP1326-20131121/49751_1 /TAXON_ID=1155430 /ORGANISM="Genus nov. species nov., Strain RCC2288" /LENGTH=136 /DNA_ID=CAMNT_0043177005 /DNA_START=36 /DNA_END=442 /DNA_ORIENTATION=-